MSKKWLTPLRHLLGWSYRRLASEVDGSVGWRWVYSLSNHPMPTFQTIHGRETQLRPKTLRVINRVAVEVAVQLGLTAGVRLRLAKRATVRPISDIQTVAGAYNAAFGWSIGFTMLAIIPALLLSMRTERSLGVTNTSPAGSSL